MPLLLLVASLCAAQPPIEGRVTSSEGNPVEGVSVTLQTRANGVKISSTDTKGEYKFEGLEPGNYGLIFEREGFARVTRLVTLTFADDSGDVDVTLGVQPDPEQSRGRPWWKRIFARAAARIAHL